MVVAVFGAGSACCGPDGCQARVYLLVMVVELPNGLWVWSLFVCDSGMLVYYCMGERKN